MCIDFKVHSNSIMDLFTAIDGFLTSILLYSVQSLKPVKMLICSTPALQCWKDHHTSQIEGWQPPAHWQPNWWIIRAKQQAVMLVELSLFFLLLMDMAGTWHQIGCSHEVQQFFAKRNHRTHQTKGKTMKKSSLRNIIEMHDAGGETKFDIE